MTHPHRQFDQTVSLLNLVRHNSTIGLASLTLSLLLTGISLFASKAASAEPATDDRLLMAQRIVDGLPPPPAMPYQAQPLSAEPITPSAEAIAPRSVPLAAPALLPQLEPADTAVEVSSPRSEPANAEVEVSQPESVAEGYLVYVNGDSPLLLNQVRQVESNAFLQSYEGQQVIQTGVFTEEASAERLVAALQAQGIGAEVTTVPRGAIESAPSQTVSYAASPDLPLPELLPLEPVDRQVEFGQSLDLAQNTPTSSGAITARAYYVVIPGDSDDLPSITDLVTLLGGGLDVPEAAIQERRSPLGPHVLVGPFTDRSRASRWNRYFRDFGMNARVYYRR